MKDYKDWTREKPSMPGIYRVCYVESEAVCGFASHWLHVGWERPDGAVKSILVARYMGGGAFSFDKWSSAPGDRSTARYHGPVRCPEDLPRPKVSWGVEAPVV